MTSILNRVRASSGPEAIIPVLVLTSAGWQEPLVLCNGYQDLQLKDEHGNDLSATATAMAVIQPAKDATVSQRLSFSVANVRHEIYNLIADTITSGAQVQAIYREYLSTDLSAPAGNPWLFTVHSVSEQAGACTVECALFDLIDTAFPRRRYDSEFAPALKYLH